jgi:predicted ferric reductase
VPVLAGFVLYAIRVMRRPMDVRLKKRRAGAFVLVAVGSAIVGIWVTSRPHNLPASYFWGELCGVLAIYLMTCALVLATRARWLEQWFGGLDRMYFWHKRSALIAIALLAPHVFVTGGSNGSQANNGLGDALGVLSLLGLLALVLISLPRAGRILRVPYERWLFMHRLIGLFVVVALVHGLSVDRVIGGSAGLKAIYILLGVIAIAAYGYDELLMRRRSPHADYTIESIDRPSDNVLDLRLAPVNRVVGPHAGQFVFLRIGGDDAWREHPFSVAGTSPDGHVRLTIRSLGRETRRMHARLEPGLPATVTGPYGMFDYTVGGPHQIWIAGGIGVAPFLSWLTSLDPADDYSIDLFYSSPSEPDAVYLEELREAERRLPRVMRLHPIFTDADGRLNGNKIVAAAEPIRPDTHVFLCGPISMVEDITHDLRRQNIPTDYIHAEHFSFR